MLLSAKNKANTICGETAKFSCEVLRIYQFIFSNPKHKSQLKSLFSNQPNFYFHFVKISSLRNVARATKRKTRSIKSNAPEIVRSVSVLLRDINLA